MSESIVYSLLLLIVGCSLMLVVALIADNYVRARQQEKLDRIVADRISRAAKRTEGVRDITARNFL